MTNAFIPVISATGLYTPTDTISNAELVASYNAYAELFNAQNPDAEPLVHSSVEFIEKASGIKSRHVIDKIAILDPAIMEPRYAERPNFADGGNWRCRLPRCAGQGWPRYRRCRRGVMCRLQYAARLSGHGGRDST